MNALIVDDDNIKADCIEDILKSFGYLDIEKVRTRSSMVNSLKDKEFSLVVLDNNFPIYDDSREIKKDLGISILKRLEIGSGVSEYFKDSKIILCSSDDIDETFDFENYLGNVIFDISIDMNSQFSKYLKEETNE